jgi:succinate dehydrogenase/fumarate reductase cytochrome b subunit
MTAAALHRLSPRGPAGLWMALLAGPAAASLQLSVNYALVKWACAAAGEWLLVVLATAFLAVSAAGAALGFVHFASPGAQREAAQAWSADSRRLLAATAIGLNLLIALLLVNTLIAYAALTPCE